MKNINKILIIFFLITLWGFCRIPQVFAVNLSFDVKGENFHQQEEFAVDVLLDTEREEDVNSFDLSISYPKNLTFLRQQEGSSIVGLWIEKPLISENTINFSGIIPGGFTGTIDSLKPNPLESKKPGVLTRLIFSGNEEGSSVLDFNKKIILSNDGDGTALEVKSNPITITIDEEIVPKKIETYDKIPPSHFSILLSKDPLMFDNKYALVFDTKDKETGIEHYEVKEDGFDWTEAESPYVTKNQPPKGTIYVKAIDNAGNFTSEEITPNIPTEKIPVLYLIIIILLLATTLLLLFIKLKRKNVL